MGAHYHQQAYTLDEKVEIPDEPAPAVGHDDEEAGAVKQASDEYREIAKAEREAESERAQEWSERDPKPKPSELLAESGREPAPESDEQQSDEDTPSNGSEVPDGTVQDVLDWVGDDKARAQSALDAERDGQNRQTLIAELERRAA